jgi:hypothetical protein
MKFLDLKNSGCILKDIISNGLVGKRGGIRLNEDVWDDQGHLDEREAEMLVEAFAKKEIKDALDDMKVNSASGPDGFIVSFFKSFCE